MTDERLIFAPTIELGLLKRVFEGRLIAVERSRPCKWCGADIALSPSGLLAVDVDPGVPVNPVGAQRPGRATFETRCGACAGVGRCVVPFDWA